MNGNRQQNRGGQTNRPPQNQRNEAAHQQQFQLSKAEIQRFIQQDDAAADMIKCTEEFGRYLSNHKVTTTQLRNAYGTMKKLEMAGWSDQQTRVKVLLIKPRLAYASGRHGHGMKDLSQVIGHAIDDIRGDDIRGPEDFQRFCHFFEAIVAYFKAAGGK